MQDIEQIRRALTRIPRSRWRESGLPPNVQVLSANANTDSVVDHSALSPESDDEFQNGLNVIGKDVESKGLEALAWYGSFHTRGGWGIYVKASGLIYLAEKWFYHLRRSRDEKLSLAHRALVHHELFHFATDRMCSFWEITTRCPMRAELRERLKGAYVEVFS